MAWALWGSDHPGPGNATLFEKQRSWQMSSGQDLKTQPAWINQWALNSRHDAEHVGKPVMPGQRGTARECLDLLAASGSRRAWRRFSRKEQPANTWIAEPSAPDLGEQTPWL